MLVRLRHFCLYIRFLTYLNVYLIISQSEANFLSSASLLIQYTRVEAVRMPPESSTSQFCLWLPSLFCMFSSSLARVLLFYSFHTCSSWDHTCVYGPCIAAGVDWVVKCGHLIQRTRLSSVQCWNFHRTIPWNSIWTLAADRKCKH